MMTSGRDASEFLAFARIYRVDKDKFFLYTFVVDNRSSGHECDNGTVAKVNLT